MLAPNNALLSPTSVATAITRAADEQPHEGMPITILL